MKWILLCSFSVAVLGGILVADIIMAPNFDYQTIAKDGKSSGGAMKHFMILTKNYENVYFGSSYAVKKSAMLGTWTVAITFNGDRMQVHRDYTARLPFIHFSTVIGDYPYE